MPKAIAICDEIQLFREGVARVLDGSKFEVVVSVRSLTEFVKYPTENGAVELIILGVGNDFSMEHTVQLMGVLRDSAALTVVLATSPTKALIRAAMASGVRAVLSKDISGEVLSSALELVLLGQKFFPAYDDAAETEPRRRASDLAAAADRLQIRLPTMSGNDDIQLSEREEQIVCRLVAGAPNKTIARDLAITDATVKVHIKGLLRKLRVTNRTQAAIWGVSHGFGDGRRSSKVVNGAVIAINGVHAQA